MMIWDETFAVDGAAVTTIDGPSYGDDLSPLRAAFRRRHALQCECTPGMLITGRAQLSKDPDADRKRIRHGRSGHLRRAGCIAIVDAGRNACAACRSKDKVQA
jgi:aerobic-type carbon monoxide dehydrogenase small subunit (CoxS/CutS family)